MPVRLPLPFGRASAQRRGAHPKISAHDYAAAARSGGAARREQLAGSGCRWDNRYMAGAQGDCQEKRHGRIGQTSRKLICLLAVVATALGSGCSASRAPTSSISLSTGDVLIPVGKVQDGDVNVDNGRVVINGTVTQSVHVGQGSVIVNGTVDRDVTLGSGSVRVNGRVRMSVDSNHGPVQVSTTGIVGRDLRAAGASLELLGNVGMSVQANDADVSIGEEAHVGRDLWAYGGSLLLNGNVGLSLNAKGTHVTLGPRSHVGRDVNVHGGSLSRT